MSIDLEKKTNELYEVYGQTMKEMKSAEAEFQQAEEEMRKKEEDFWNAKLKMVNPMVEYIKTKDVYIVEKEPDEEILNGDLKTRFPMDFYGVASLHNEKMTRFFWLEQFGEEPDALVEVSINEYDLDPTIYVYISKPDKTDEDIRELAVNAIHGFHDHCAQYFDDRDFFNHRQTNPRRFLYPYVDEKLIQGYYSSAR
ncbi:TPA: hypothetical protein L5065_000868 [Escherichia coli]|uniref:hypothetical protein n=1 Tax=Escherichia coli TaxID=562 RepID=UPI000DA47DF6|nr:hypothetical protein [Escherichia coli]EIT7417816.1 hypothetical protein [Escherichia coli]ELL2823902.1 hypothetical protein [Escherichia coli]MDW9262574.1 hypothetical protein [Escherichia coli]UUP46341.1 hypothetical protein KFU83_22625 [Escherichia coli]SQS47935.1 Uncharacterised protein [Escherichia coli]